MKLIRLYRKKYEDLFAIVDDSDYEFLSSYRWTVQRGGNTFYPVTYSYSGGKQQYVFMYRLLIITTTIQEIDHIDGNGLNNRRCNLRAFIHAQNMANRSLHKSSTSGYKGVYWEARRNRWVARIKVSGRRIWLGRFTSREDAAASYNEAAVLYFGEYARLNVLSPKT